MSNEIVNLKYYKGKDYQYIGRGSIFGSPFEISENCNREQSIEKYKIWFSFLLKDKRFLLELEKLRDKKLGCWCKEEGKEILCHGDIIASYLNNTKPLQTKKKLAVIGSRGFNNKDWVFRVLNKNRDKIECIISGGCKNSADEISHEWAKETGIPITIYYPGWHDTEDGMVDRSRGFKRNYYIINAADQILAWWDMTSKGTANSIEIAKTMNKPLKIFTFTPNVST